MEADWYCLIWKDKTFLEINLLRSCWFNLWQKVSWIQFITQLFFGGRLPAWWMSSGRPETEVHYSPKFNWHPRDVDIFNIDESGNVDDNNNQRYVRRTLSGWCWQSQWQCWWLQLGKCVGSFNYQSDGDIWTLLTFSITRVMLTSKQCWHFQYWPSQSESGDYCSSQMKSGSSSHWVHNCIFTDQAL